MKRLQKRVGSVLPDTIDDRVCEPLQVSDSVDITSSCRGRGITRRVIVDYGQSSEGIFTRIVDEGTGAAQVVYLDWFEDDLDHTRFAPLRGLAQGFGLRIEELVLIVKKFAPPWNRDKALAFFRKEADLGPGMDFEVRLRKAGCTYADLIHA